MSYTVEVGDEAFAAILEAARFIAIDRHAPNNAERWLDRLWSAIDGLEDMPRRFAIDPDQTAATGKATHKMNFGDYLMFYQVDEEHTRVHVVAFMHGARRG